LDASLKISGRLDGYLGTIQGGELTTAGSLGEKSVHWLSMILSLPPEAAIRPPLSVSQARLTWKGKDTLSCAGTLSFPKGPSITLDVLRDPRKLAINVLRVEDGDNRANIG
jgi:hypothetical protein